MTNSKAALSKAQQQMLTDVLDGLGSAPKTLPSKYFYDEQGSRIFDEITELPEYYPTRTEAGIMQDHGQQIAETLGDGVSLIEFGSGSSIKTRLLLDKMHKLASYVPVDVSGDYLQQIANTLQNDYPHIPIHPVVADFTHDFTVPATKVPERRRIIYFPGSTLGNFTPFAAVQLMRHMVNLVGPQGGALIGIDLLKPRELLIAAYNDAQNVTARFNLNLLQRLNRELGANFDTAQFRHKAIFDLDNERIEMRLLSQCVQDVHVGDMQFHFEEGESILTEYSHKYSLQSFAALAEKAGLQVETVWSDADSLFSVQYLNVI